MQPAAVGLNPRAVAPTFCTQLSAADGTAPACFVRNSSEWPICPCDGAPTHIAILNRAAIDWRLAERTYALFVATSFDPAQQAHCWREAQTVPEIGVATGRALDDRDVA